MSETLSEQLVIPYDSGPVREIAWFNAVQTEKKRRFLRNKVLTDLILDDENYGLPTTTNVPSTDLDKVKDPNLRYALRFADAAEAVGWIQNSPGSKSMHHVSVTATDEGRFDSKFLGASYTGIGSGDEDTFMNNLRRCAPAPEIPMLVVDDESRPGTRYWVQRDPLVEG